MSSRIKLSEIIDVWEILHMKHTGEIGYCDVQNALEEVGVQIQNDCLSLPMIQKRLRERTTVNPI